VATFVPALLAVADWPSLKAMTRFLALAGGGKYREVGGVVPVASPEV
jgi:hypothetical protein